MSTPETESGRAPGGLPPSIVLYQLSVGHYVSRALDLAARLGLADLLEDGPRNIQDLASATETHAPSLQRVMRLLASVGIFKELDPGTFELTPLGELLRTGAEGSMRASVMLFAGIGIQDSWKELEYCVRSGEPAFRRHSPDADPFTEMARNPEQAALFDQAHVAGRAEEQLKSAGMADRCEVVAGSFFDEVPGGVDAYLLKHVIHDWNDERAAAILQTCHRAMPPHAKLLIVEGVYPEAIDRSLASRGAAANDVNMLVCTGGRQRSQAEFQHLFAASGFRLTRVVPTLSGVCVVEGERA